MLKLFWTKTALELNGRCITPSPSSWTVSSPLGRSKTCLIMAELWSSTSHNAFQGAPLPIGRPLLTSTPKQTLSKPILNVKIASNTIFRNPEHGVHWRHGDRQSPALETSSRFLYEPCWLHHSGDQLSTSLKDICARKQRFKMSVH